MIEPKFKMPARPGKLVAFSDQLTRMLKVEAGKPRKQKRTLPFRLLQDVCDREKVMAEVVGFEPKVELSAYCYLDWTSLTPYALVVVVGGITDANIRASLAICGALGDADVASDVAQRSPNHVYSIRQKDRDAQNHLSEKSGAR